MLGFVLDENLRGRLWQAIQRHNARGIDTVDVVRVGDLTGLPLKSVDPDILDWAEREGRILISKDRKTLGRHLADHLAKGHHSPGIFLIRRRSKLPPIVAFLALVAYTSNASEWQDSIEHIP